MIQAVSQDFEVSLRCNLKNDDSSLKNENS